MTLDSPSPKVFISYSHDSQEHKDRVLELADRLREDGIDCNIDQYEESPPESWQRWMLNQIEAADFVLVACTKQYDRRFRGREEIGKGKGVTWEGGVIIQELYDAQGRNSKFIPITLTPGDSEFIPSPLRSANLYRMDTAEGYELLYRRLTNQPKIRKPDLGKLRSLPSRERKQLFNDFFLFQGNLSDTGTQQALQQVRQILQKFNDLDTIKQAYRDALPADAALSRSEVANYRDMVAQLQEFRRLPAFIDRLVQNQQVPSDIRHPLKDVLQQLNQTEGWKQPVVSATTTPEILQSCLQVVLCLENKSNQLRVNAWLIPDGTDLDTAIPLDLDEQQKGASCTIEEVPKVLEKFLELSLDALYGKRHVLTIEIFLPLEYLCFDVDGWVLTEDLGFTIEPFVLGSKYRVIVRSQERLNPKYLKSQLTQWHDNWDRVKTRLNTAPDEDDFEHFSQFEYCNWNQLVSNLKQKLGLKLTCGLVEAHQKDLFTSILRAATPIAIWTRCPLPHLDSISAINQLILSSALLDLSEAIRKTRELASISEVPREHLGCHLAILWEDPHRLTPDVMAQLIQLGQ